MSHCLSVLGFACTITFYLKYNCLFPLLYLGLLKDDKQSKKEKFWADYKAQLLYIDAMREAKEDPEFDPRRTHIVTGKDGRYEKIGKAATLIPKNPLTVQYLCHAYAIPYPTFKRWKQDAFCH